MRVGNYEVSTIVTDTFALDGGSFFGALPFGLWSKWITPDEKLRVEIAARSFIIKGQGRRILVDTGIGSLCLDEKAASYLNLKNILDWRVQGPFTDIILTHLHFDHAGGIVGDIPTNKPMVHLSKRQVDVCKNPTAKERGSFKISISLALDNYPHVSFVSDGDEFAPGIKVFFSDGNTESMLGLKLETEDAVLVLASDLFPTQHHLKPHYTLGYDRFAERTETEKLGILKLAERKKLYLGFCHDPEIALARIEPEVSKSIGSFSIKETFKE